MKDMIVFFPFALSLSKGSCCSGHPGFDRLSPDGLLFAVS
jgi:hypothetical protein